MPFLAPVVAAIGSAFTAVSGFMAGLGFIGKALISIGLNVAMGFIQSALTKKPRGGTQLDREYGGNVSRKVACGLVCMKGHDCYINTHGKSNRFAQNVYALSDFPCDGLSRIAIDGEWVTLGEEDAQKGFKVTSGEHKNFAWIKFIDGRQTVADAALVANAKPAGRWTSDHKGVGVCYAILSTTYHRDDHNTFPDVFFEFRGARLYDWRKDSSVGGSGAHRWNDQSTWEYSANPVIIDYNYRRGFSVNGDLFCGMGMPASDLPLAKYTAAANLCDEMVGLDRRYVCSVLLDAGSDANHGNNIESLMLSCGGMVVDGVDGSWPIVGSDQPIVATLTDDDLIVGAPCRFQKTRSMADIVNSVSGNFPHPDELWGMTGYEQQLSAAGLVLDRRSRDLSIDFPMVPVKRQAEQLASIYLLENRLQATATITVRPRWQFLEPGDWVTWASARYGTRDYLVAGASLAALTADGPRNVTLTLQERDGSIYDPITSTPIVIPTPPGLPDYDEELFNFEALPVVYENEAGHKRPALRISWDMPQDDTVSAILIEYWPTNDPTAVVSKTVPVDQTVLLVAEAIIGETQYSIRHKLVTIPERTTVWSDPVLATTPAVLLTDIAVSLSTFQDDVRNLLLGTQQNFAELRDRLEQLAASTAISSGKQIEQTSAIVRTANALAASFLILEAAITDDETGLQALATAILGVEAQVGNVTAGGLIQFIAQVPPPDGVLSQINIMARASTGDDFEESGLAIQAYDSGGGVLKGRVVILADQFVVWDGENENSPLVYEEGQLKLNVARIGTAIVELFQTPSGKTRFGVLAPSIEGLEVWT
jgi:hypothetical protein